MPVTFNRDNSDCERINILNSANLEDGLLSLKDLARILNCGHTKAWELVSTPGSDHTGGPSRANFAG